MSLLRYDATSGVDAQNQIVIGKEASGQGDNLRSLEMLH